jgi:hypothetical protein
MKIRQISKPTLNNIMKIKMWARNWNSAEVLQSYGGDGIIIRQ